MKVIIIRNIFTWSRQVNCVLLYSLQLKWVLWFFQVPEFSFNYSSLKAGVQYPWHRVLLTWPNWQRAILPCQVTRSTSLRHPSPGALGWSFLSSWHHGDAGTAAATSAWAGGCTADSSTEGFLCRTQESRGEVRSFVRVHDLQGSESLS